MTFHSLLPDLRERAEGIKKTNMYDNARKRIKNTNKERGENIGTRVTCPFAACGYLFQTYTPSPDTTHTNSKECCVPIGSRVQAGKAMTFSENNGKHRRYL